MVQEENFSQGTETDETVQSLQTHPTAAGAQLQRRTL